MSSNSWRENIIRDGFTQQGYIKEIPFLHGEQRFEFRPMLVDDLEVVDSEKTKADARGDIQKRLMIMRTEMAKRLVSCEGLNNITIDSLTRIKPPVFYRMWSIILGDSPSDADPEAKPDVNDAQQYANQPRTPEDQIKN